jgi:hypothetical protein
MASIHREVVIGASPESVWDALRDVGAVHTRLAPGFVTNVQLDNGDRVVTFGNGAVARESIIDVNDREMRVAWSARDGRLEHYHASAQVFPAGDGHSRFVWIADLLPNELTAEITVMIEQGLAVIKRTLEGGAAH